MEVNSVLRILSTFAFDFGVAALILSAASAIFIHFLYDLGLRSYLHRLSIRTWLHERSEKKLGIDPLGELTKDPKGWKDLYLLPHQQLCGQISNYVQSLKDPSESGLAKAIAPSIPSTGELYETGDEDRAYLLERGIDKLQTYMGNFVRLAEYILTLALPLVLVLIVVRSNPVESIFSRFVLYVVLVVVAAVLAQMWRILLERVMNRD
ncbi:MAG: hypothetical protein OEU36_19165 [Gammaproteobacteria bacterium]|nr:hypothetical protein [Gammaproteobacteria bacterium]